MPTITVSSLEVLWADMAIRESSIRYYKVPDGFKPVGYKDEGGHSYINYVRRKDV